MAHGLTDDELDHLSDAEREAIESMDDDDIGDTGEDDDLDDEGDEDEGDAGDDDGDGEQDDEGDGDGEDEGEDEGDEQPEFRAAPSLSVDDAHAKLTDIEAKKAELRTKLNDGDIALDEYTEQYDALAKEERAAERAVWQSEQSQQVEKQRWDWEQEQFFNAKENAAYKDKYLLTALDAAIKDLAKDPSNAGKKGPWFLAEADKMIRQRFNMQPAGDKQDKGGKTGRKARPTAPPTLAGIPSAEHPDTGGGDEFAHLDRLEGFALEAALAKLSPDQQNRYLGVMD